MSQAIRKPAPRESDTVCLARGGAEIYRVLSLDITVQESFRQAYLPSTLNPERELMVKVVEDALETFADGRFPRPNESRDRRNRRLEEYRESRRWIFDDEEDWVFSFMRVCDWLEINPDRLREACRKYDREEHVEKTKRQRGIRHEASRANGWGNGVRRYVKAG